MRIHSPITILIILLAIFILPMVFAKYYYTHHWTSHTVNKGKLLNPPQKLPLLAKEKGVWILLYVDVSCDTLCGQNIHKLDNIQIATGKNQLRVKVVPVTNGVLSLPAGFYIVDPLGNAILQYQKTVNPEDIYKDLTRLLRVSQIG